MSYILDPPALFLLGMMGYYLWKRLNGVISDEWREIFATGFGAFFCFIAFMIGSTTLYLDWWDWPIPPTEGPVWMFHTDFTGIAIGDVEVWIAVVMLFLYPLWYLLGFRFAKLADEGILPRQTVSVRDVRSKRKPTESKVVIKRNEPPRKLLELALGALGGIEKFVEPGQRVLIKPNISGGNPTIPGSFTSIEIVDELVKMIRKIGAEVIVADSDMIWTKMKPVAEQQGWVQWARENDVTLLNLAETDWVQFDFGKGSKIGKVPVSRKLVEADVIISVPTMKTHLLTNITVAMKNMYGTFPQENKAKYHRFGIEDVIYEVCNAFTPNLTIIDGTIGGEAWGPLSCRPVDFGTVIASNNVVAADSVACQLMGFKPEEVLHVKKGVDEGLGRIVPLDELDYPSHEKDGKWARPEPLATYFYEALCEIVLLVPTMQMFFDLAADIVLYRFATVPGFRESTPIVLGVLNDLIGGMLRAGYELAIVSQERFEDLAKGVAEWETKVSDGRTQSAQILASRLLTNKNDWPRVALANAVEELRNEFANNKDTIKLKTPHNVLDFKDESVKEQIREFAPEVKLIGLGLWNEKKSLLTTLLGKRAAFLRPWKHEYWGGVMSRVLQKKDDKKRRCLQYMYLYTRQRGTVSFFWMVILPLMMYLWTEYLRFLFFIEGLTSSLFIQFLAFFLAPLPVLLMALGVHGEDIYRNPKGQKFVFRSTTPIIIFYPLMAFSWLWPELSYGLLISSALFTLIWLIEYTPLSLTSHDMDYVPVFIWLEQISDEEKKQMGDEKANRFVGKDNWTITYVAWDCYHHCTQPTYRDELVNYTKNKRILLEIPDTWHAMEPERVAGVTGTFKRALFQLGMVGCLLMFVVGISLRLDIIPQISQMLLDLGVYEFTRSVLVPTMFIIFGILIVRGRFKLVDSIDNYTKETADMTDLKLHDLWNLDEKPRLKVITKLQYPFSAFEFGKEVKQTFNDDVFFVYGLV